MLVIITGASRGIGFETCRKIAKNPKNMVLAVSRNTRSVAQLAEKENLHNILPVKADISTSKGIAEVKKVCSRLGLPVDVLINNAGQLLKKDFTQIKLKELQSVYHTNVFTPFLLTQALLPYFQKPSHIINIGSMGGFQGSSKFAGLSAYSSSKGALATLTECMAEEFREQGISVNCLAIGAVQTEMLSAAFPGYRAPLSAKDMATFLADFAAQGARWFNGKVLPVSSSTP